MLKLGGNRDIEMERLNALFEHATEGIIIANKEGVIESANPSSEQLFGYEQGELFGLKIEQLIPDRFKKNHSKQRNDYMKSPHARAMGKGIELFAKRKNGDEFPVEISLTYYEKGNESFAIAFIIDITERKKAEEAIRQSNADLERKVNERTRILQETLIELEASKRELQLALDKEKELNDMKSRFVTMASHEFRTPLSTILSSVSLIAKYKTEDEDEKRTRHVERIKSSVANMTLILNDFLSAGKLDEGKVTSNPAEIDVAEFVREITTELTNLLKPGQKIQYTHRGIKNIVMDPQFFRNILINLLSNAVKFSAENKTIYVTTEVGDEVFELSVKDEGLGIPPEEHKNLFERFFRAKNVSNIQGTGLGLNIVSKYVEMLNGSINFESELNKGTTFHLSFPINH